MQYLLYFFYKQPPWRLHCPHSCRQPLCQIHHSTGITVTHYHNRPLSRRHAPQSIDHPQPCRALVEPTHTTIGTLFNYRHDSLTIGTPRNWQATSSRVLPMHPIGPRTKKSTPEGVLSFARYNPYGSRGSSGFVLFINSFKSPYPSPSVSTRSLSVPRASSKSSSIPSASESRKPLSL